MHVQKYRIDTVHIYVIYQFYSGYTVVYIIGWHYENISIGIPRRLALDPQDDWAFEM